MKVVGIGGAPATGKTTVMWKFINTLKDESKVLTLGKLKCMVYEQDKVIILGLYSGKINDGTDRLSMSAQKDAIAFLGFVKQKPELKDFKIVFEGDRLFYDGFVDTAIALAEACKFIVLVTSEKTAELRMQYRGTNQAPAFIKGRRTKYHNMLLNKGINPDHYVPQGKFGILTHPLAKPTLFEKHNEIMAMWENETPEDSEAVLKLLQEF